jgi:hypothetical protein
LDTHNGVASDVFAKKEFVQNITDACLPGLTLCAFKKVADHNPLIGGETFEKTLQDARGKTLKVRLKLANASLTSVMLKNEDTYWKEQYYRSVEIERAYLESLNTDDVVLYTGHSRYGTGIGFRPFDTGSVPWLRAWILQPMKTSVEKTLHQASSPAKILGFFSCDSDAHYGRTLHAANPDTALLLTRGPLAIRDLPTTLFAGINSLISGHCEEQLQTSLRIGTRTFYYFKGEPKPVDFFAEAPKLFNFFADDTNELVPRKPLRDALRTEYQVRSVYEVK